MTCYMCNCSSPTCVWKHLWVGKVPMEALVCRDCAKKVNSE